MSIKFCVLAFACVFLREVCGHGMMLDPPNRSSLWRFDKTAPINYDDDSNWCGGMTAQWNQFGGKCGVCGDRYDRPHPQENENTGKYGQGKVVAKYPSGSVVTTSIRLTANHRGKFTYSLCVLGNPKTFEPENCFADLTFEDGTKSFPVAGGVSEFKNKVKLPAGVKCERCVLRWTYTAGNNWGQCDDGSWANGCGPQETFRSCSDIAIV